MENRGEWEGEESKGGGWEIRGCDWGEGRRKENKGGGEQKREKVF